MGVESSKTTQNRLVTHFFLKKFFLEPMEKKQVFFPVWFYNMCCYKDRTLKKYLGFSLLALLQVRMSSKKQKLKVFLLLGIQKKLDQAKNMFGPQTKTSPKSFVVLVLWFYEYSRNNKK